MMRAIGITGGIGSGKSTIARTFQSLGYLVYFADDRAKALYDENATLKAAVKELASADVYDADDKLIRPHLAARIFSDKALLAKINALVHPAVASDYEDWIKAIPAEYSKEFVLKEAAILFEAGSYTALDGVIMVYAPIQVRLERVGKRDGVTDAQIRARMTNQWPDSTKLLRSDFVIYNDGIHHFSPQVTAAIQHFNHL